MCCAISRKGIYLKKKAKNIYSFFKAKTFLAISIFTISIKTPLHINAYFNGITDRICLQNAIYNAVTDIMTDLVVAIATPLLCSTRT